MSKKNKDKNNPFYGKKHSEESKEKMRLTHKNKILSEKHKKKIGISNTGKKRTEEVKKRISNSEKGKIVSKETRKKISLSKLKNWKDKNYREKQIKAILNGSDLTPNKPEKLLIKLLNKLLPKEYKFVGDGKVILKGYNPDFINVNGQKKIIEHFGTYWHNLSTYKSRDKKRLKVYSDYGYKTLIIWENELENLDKVKEKIVKFNKEI